MTVAVSDPTYKPGAGAASWRAPRPAIHQRPEGRSVPGLYGGVDRDRHPDGGRALRARRVPLVAGRVHLAVFVYFLGPFVLMLAQHEPPEAFQAALGLDQHYIPWVLGPVLRGDRPRRTSPITSGCITPRTTSRTTSAPRCRTGATASATSSLLFRFFFIGLVELTGYLRAERRRRSWSDRHGGALRSSPWRWGSALRELARHPDGLGASAGRRALRDDGGQLGPARLHRRIVAREQLSQQHHVHQQQL